MEYWENINQLSHQVLCCLCLEEIKIFLTLEEIKSFKVIVKRDVKGKQILCGYADIFLAINENHFNYKFLVSWGHEKYEPMKFWKTTLEQKYLSAHNDLFINKFNITYDIIDKYWKYISEWIVFSTDNKELSLQSPLDITQLMGNKFNPIFSRHKLELLLEDKTLISNLTKI